ncbi:hypothetical protein SPONN_546 [uncultured Candidatus Thioglobus sp.]|nr:hypothetical protein SPONN_546 [uncultured Candidatus Thioglobus sp.]
MYEIQFSKDFEKDVKKLKGKQADNLAKKIIEIQTTDNLERYKNLRNKLKEFKRIHISRDLYINMNNHQKSTFHQLGNFLNPALSLLGQGLRKSPIWQKLNFANHPYLCKGL